MGHLKTDGIPFEAEFLVDIGAIDCLAPALALAQAGISSEGRDVYELANGDLAAYPMAPSLLRRQLQIK